MPMEVIAISRVLEGVVGILTRRRLFVYNLRLDVTRGIDTIE